MKKGMKSMKKGMKAMKKIRQEYEKEGDEEIHHCQGQAREELRLPRHEGAHQRRSEKRCAHQEQERKDCEQEAELAGQGYLQEERHYEVDCSGDAGAKGPRNRRVVQRRGQHAEREGLVGEGEVLLQEVSVSHGTSLRGYTLPLLLLSRPSPLGREGAGERCDGFVRRCVRGCTFSVLLQGRTPRIKAARRGVVP